MTTTAAYLTAIQQARKAYETMLDRPVDDSGLAESIRLQIDVGLAYDDLLEWLRRSDEYQAKQPTPPPPSGNAALPPLEGQLYNDGMAYADATGRRIPLFCHAGDLLCLFVEGRLEGNQSKDQRVHQAFADMRDHGYAGLRSWWSICWHQAHPYWEGRRLNPSNQDHRRLIEECFRIGSQDYGLQWHTALGSAERVPPHEMDEAWDWMGEVVHRHPTWFALVEGLNEAYYTGESNPDVVERWVNRSRTKNPDVLHGLSAAAGANGSENHDELVKWTPEWQQMYLVHAYRGGNWGDQTRHVFSSAYEDPPRRCGWSGEPPGVQCGPYQRVSALDHPEQWTERPWRYAFYLAQTAICRQVPTFFCSHGVCLEGRLIDAPAFTITPRLIHDLPPDIMAYEELFHGGATHRAKRIIQAPEHCRADHALKSNGACVITVYPEDPEIRDIDIIFERAWKGRIHDEFGYTDVVIDRGQVIRRDVSSGLLFVGEVL
jgi:hypothetical protein